MRILIAEDDMTSRLMLQAVLSKWGYETVVVEDGKSAWAIMQQNDAPSLALLDWEMPEMDGLAVCRRIRENNPPNPPYLIILTSRGDKADIVAGLNSGANDYISKPYDNSELQARINVGQRMVDLQTELLDAKNALAYEAMHDPLTGALNRKAIIECLAKELTRTMRRGSTLSIGLCAIDHFKLVNDTYGHQAGDAVLCSFVNTIQNCLRGYDLVGRYGGEEFLIVAPDSTGSSRDGLYERLRKQIDRLQTTTKPGVVRVTVSIGVAGTGHSTTVDALLEEADAALYRAKEAGRNRVEYAATGGQYPNNID
jgi:two-component system, cell cycle response regulator